MVMAYVASDFKQKGTAKWMPMIFAGISENKQYIVLRGKTHEVDEINQENFS